MKIRGTIFACIYVPMRGRPSAEFLLLSAVLYEHETALLDPIVFDITRCLLYCIAISGSDECNVTINQKEFKMILFHF